MFEHLEIGAVETFTPPGELLKKEVWHKDVWSIIDYFFRINKNDPEIKDLCSRCQGLPYKVYWDLTLYYERRGLPAFSRKVIPHIISTLNKYYEVYNIVQKNNVSPKKDCTIMPFKKPGTKSH